MCPKQISHTSNLIVDEGSLTVGTSLISPGTKILRRLDTHLDQLEPDGQMT